MANPAILSVEPQASASADIEWLLSPAPVPYAAAIKAMKGRVAAIIAGRAPETVWLLEHPPLYTAGTSAAPEELLEPSRLPVFRTGRGGRFTYHGPRQRVAYVMLDLGRRGRDVRAFVHRLEDWLIATVARLGVEGERHEGQIGVFVGEAKIASIGIRVRHWMSFHGVSLNVDPDLAHFSGIVPCGLKAPVTSLAALGIHADMERVDTALHDSFDEVFGTTPISTNSYR
ncbi:MAG TPA: lipoyl(octanoyl) transferase LipB [Methyloceanibacter sp.]|nr:lipoyl(octanoyl) transferase LipB [Methyloceanibacter sp.]